MNIKEGNRARCCVLGIGGTDEGTDGGKPSDGCTDGDGEGGRDMVVWDRTLPFDLRSKIKINTDVLEQHHKLTNSSPAAASFSSPLHHFLRTAQPYPDCRTLPFYYHLSLLLVFQEYPVKK